jgi:hypothetical protein
MATDNNYDIIQNTTSEGSCECGESDFSEFFMSKTGATTFTAGITGGIDLTSWLYDTDKATLTLGKATTAGLSELVVQGNSNNVARIQVKGVNTLTLTPAGINGLSYQAGSASADAHFKATSTTLHVGGDSVFHGDIVPTTDSSFTLGTDGVRWSNIYSDDLTSSAATIDTLSVTTLNLASLSLTGSLTVDSNDSGDLTQLNGPVNLGSTDNDGDAIIVKGNLTTEGTVTLGSAGKTLIIGNTSGTTQLGASLDATAKNITSVGDISSTTAHVATTPTEAADVVRYTDVNINDAATASFVLPQVTVSSGFITAITEGNVGNLLSHAVKHKTTTKTTASPSGVGGGDDPLASYEIGAVERTHPVVGRPLKITPSTSSNYDYDSSDTIKPQNYFVIIGVNDALPDSANAIEGQILFRKRDS